MWAGANMTAAKDSILVPTLLKLCAGYKVNGLVVRITYMLGKQTIEAFAIRKIVARQAGYNGVVVAPPDRIDIDLRGPPGNIQSVFLMAFPRISSAV